MFVELEMISYPTPDDQLEVSGGVQRVESKQQPKLQDTRTTVSLVSTHV